MSFTAEPIVGEWYHDNEQDFDFEIVSVDEYDGLITIRREDADEDEEVTLDDWDEMLIEPADSPLRDKGLENDFSSESDFEEKEELDDDFELEDE